ncbi:hypothetical protein ACKWTF_012730 [Chironomus riparius]
MMKKKIHNVYFSVIKFLSKTLLVPVYFNIRCRRIFHNSFIGSKFMKKKTIEMTENSKIVHTNARIFHGELEIEHCGFSIGHHEAQQYVLMLHTSRMSGLSLVRAREQARETEMKKNLNLKRRSVAHMRTCFPSLQQCCMHCLSILGEQINIQHRFRPM